MKPGTPESRDHQVGGVVPIHRRHHLGKSLTGDIRPTESPCGGSAVKEHIYGPTNRILFEKWVIDKFEPCSKMLLRTREIAAEEPYRQLEII